MSTFPEAASWREACIGDASLAAWAGPWSVCFAVASGADTTVFRLEDGKVQPGGGEPAFTLSAPAGIWAKFLLPIPPRHHHGLFAMHYRLPEFAIQGDQLVFMQHAHVARRILEALRHPFPIGDSDVSVSASIGVACGSGSTENLLRDADMAMYGAKSAGRNRYEVFDPATHQADHNRLRLESDLVYAIERDQLRVLYQPVVDLRTDAVVGFEALLRWEHPEFGTISPLDFIPMAEETGLIVAVGRWVLDEACAQARHWQMAHPRSEPLTMAVNVSARQLQESLFVDEVQSALDRQALAPRTLTLEITESVLLDESTAIGQRLVELKRTGVRLAIDDFGTGYSSLSYLRQFPIDILKIDRTFTNLVEGPGPVPPLLEGLVFLGRQLGLELVAEGIEMGEQRDQLERLQCRLGQGYLWAPPLTVDACDELLRRPSPGPVPDRYVALPGAQAADPRGSGRLPGVLSRPNRS